MSNKVIENLKTRILQLGEEVETVEKARDQFANDAYEANQRVKVLEQQLKEAREREKTPEIVDND